MRPSKQTTLALWVALTSQIKRLEKQKEDLKPQLEKILEKEPENTLELDGWRAILVASERESFRLKEAKEKIDEKVLKPFITHSKYTQIRTSWQGGGEPAL
jgi:regulator of replication initiation timing